MISSDPSVHALRHSVERLSNVHRLVNEALSSYSEVLDELHASCKTEGNPTNQSNTATDNLLPNLNNADDFDAVNQDLKSLERVLGELVDAVSSDVDAKKIGRVLLNPVVSENPTPAATTSTKSPLAKETPAEPLMKPMHMPPLNIGTIEERKRRLNRQQPSSSYASAASAPSPSSIPTSPTLRKPASTSGSSQFIREIDPTKFYVLFGIVATVFLVFLMLLVFLYQRGSI